MENDLGKRLGRSKHSRFLTIIFFCFTLTRDQWGSENPLFCSIMMILTRIQFLTYRCWETLLFTLWQSVFNSSDISEYFMLLPESFVSGGKAESGCPVWMSFVKNTPPLLNPPVLFCIDIFDNFSFPGKFSRLLSVADRAMLVLLLLLWPVHFFCWKRGAPPPVLDQVTQHKLEFR